MTKTMRFPQQHNNRGSTSENVSDGHYRPAAQDSDQVQSVKESYNDRGRMAERLRHLPRLRAGATDVPAAVSHFSFPNSFIHSRCSFCFRDFREAIKDLF